MTPHMDPARIDEQELQSRRAFFEITGEDLQRLASLRSFADEVTDAIIEQLYELILGHPEAARMFKEHETVARVKKAQREYFVGLFAGRCDLAYVEDRLRIGIAHERVGIPPKWYLGAYAKYMRIISDFMFDKLPDAQTARLAYQSVSKLIAFDMALAMDAYIAAGHATIARQQAAVRELSTPVIRIHHRVLLLPLIGTIDTRRAEQLMESVLLKVAQEKAKVLIIDIAGVPIVDTEVAQHLLNTAHAVRLLGGNSILSGIAPTIAKTLVNLGVDISGLHTTHQLDEGLELALQLIGHEIRAQGDVRGDGRTRGRR